MLILTIRTDKPEAELGLYKDNKQLGYVTWQAHRQLAETVHLKIDELLKANKVSFNNIEGIVFYKGPGSFTGLRIGAAVANTLAVSLKISIVGSKSETWVPNGLEYLVKAKDINIIVPEYGAPVHITQQKK